MIFTWDKNLSSQLADFLVEDGLDQSQFLLLNHPKNFVNTQIKWKSNLIVAGMPLVCSYLKQYCKIESEDLQKFMNLEGKWMSAGSISNIELPFASFIFLERTMLNLLHRLSSIATTTQEFVKRAKPIGIEILDTRKTTPGIRSFERYAVCVGGGKNHRNNFTDSVMIKDNQKSFFGGLKNAWDYYQKNKSFYQPIIVEIHNLNEFVVAKNLGVKHVMLDNFSPVQIKEVVKLKNKDMTIELSGGINLENLEQYLITGVDAISLSTITFWPSKVDVSWKVIK